MTHTTRSASVHGFDDLVEYGFNCLTGEACAYGQRTLFDVSQRGAEMFAKFMGLKAATLYPNWNSMVDTEPAIGSILMTPATVWDLAVYIMLERRFSVIIPNQPEHHGVYAFDVDSIAAMEYYQRAKAQYTVYSHPGSSDRHVHAFTGRTV